MKNTTFKYFEQYYWGENYDVSGITNNKTVDGSNSYGKLKVVIPEDYKQWTAGAISDFDGKLNTSKMAENGTNSVIYLLNQFCANEEDSYGWDDWYIPSCGQIGLIGLNVDAINATLVKIGGSPLRNFNNTNNTTWTSSEYDASFAWVINFKTLNISQGMRKSQDEGYVRFIRDI